MSDRWQSTLDRWLGAGLLDAAAAERIRAWEQAHGGEAKTSRITLIVFAFGGLLLTAGLLLFVAANWDSMTPAARFGLVLAMIAVLHASGAVATRSSPALSATLHAAGTAALGAGIYLSGQIFHMAEHWPGALMLWSIGAAVGVWMLREWPQVLWLALLAPAWLWGEWIESQPRFAAWENTEAMSVGLFLLACVYLAATPPHSSVRWRRALGWLGAIALIPSAAGVLFSSMSDDWPFMAERREIGRTAMIVGWTLAIVLPFALAWFLRGRDALWLLAALAWAVVLSQTSGGSGSLELAQHALLALGAVGIVLWGIRDQQRLAINIGVLAFAITVLAFYFSSLYDRLGRAFGLIGIGILFIGGGWLLERMRRRLVGRVQKGGA